MGYKSKFELAVIDLVKEMRIKKQLSQDDIALFINTTRGFVGQIESPNFDSKYNLDHLNKLASEMGCSPKDFLPKEPIQE